MTATGLGGRGSGGRHPVLGARGGGSVEKGGNGWWEVMCWQMLLIDVTLNPGHGLGVTCTNDTTEIHMALWCNGYMCICLWLVLLMSRVRLPLATNFC